MKQRIALVSCAKSKKDVPAPAAELYTSTLFRSCKEYAESNADQWYILSAEHGLLHPEEVVAPYERTLKRMRMSERLDWAERVQRQLLETLPPQSEITLLAGECYRENLIPFLKEHGFTVRIPLLGLPFGKQLRRLKALNNPVNRPIDRFYEILGLLAEHADQGRPLATYTGRSGWPTRGVYFFLEPGESRSGHEGALRVVRVGTHAVSAGSQSSLWGRLRAHRGGKYGSGNHRGSIFRLHVGEALLRRSPEPDVASQSWGTRVPADEALRAREAVLEQQVSEHIGRMPVLWVAVDDPPGPNSMRAFIERNSIALLSNNMDPFDPPSRNWLGQQSEREEIRTSGLWNLNHVSEESDLSFLDVFEAYVKGTLAGELPGRLPRQEQPIGPPIFGGDKEEPAGERVAFVPRARRQPRELATPARVLYPSRSSFLDPIAVALDNATDQLSSGSTVIVKLKSGGYDGEYLVRVDEDAENFLTDWIGTDLSRFPARLRAAARALRDREEYGLFSISHTSGQLAITRLN